MYHPPEVVLLPFSDLSANKKRPVLILKSPNFQGDFLAVQITSQSGFENALVLQQCDFEVGLLPKTILRAVMFAAFMAMLFGPRARRENRRIAGYVTVFATPQSDKRSRQKTANVTARSIAMFVPISW